MDAPRGGKEKFSRGHGRWVVASIPEVEGFIKLIHLPLPPDDITREAVYQEAAQHIPFGEDAYYLDFQILFPEDSAVARDTAVLIGSTLKTVADSYTYLLESMGLGVAALEIDALATARAMITADKAYVNEARAILEIGATRSSFIVYDHDVVQFSTSLPFSGEIVTMAIEHKLNIPHEEAQKQKHEHGLSYREGPAWPVIAQLVDQFTADIQKGIEFYYSHFPDTNPITRITMCGGSASMDGLADVLTEKLAIETAPGDPWKNARLRRPPPLFPADSLQYASAIGLALRAACNPLHGGLHTNV